MPYTLSISGEAIWWCFHFLTVAARWGRLRWRLGEFPCDGGGVVHGTFATCEFGYYVTENKVTMPDFRATILHTLGLDHEKLTFRFGGRDYRLTDVHGQVVQKLLL
ncbi:MAG: DUF1501 domain-containing protein [Planctomycetaceae bacterium]